MLIVDNREKEPQGQFFSHDINPAWEHWLGVLPSSLEHAVLRVLKQWSDEIADSAAAAASSYPVSKSCLQH